MGFNYCYLLLVHISVYIQATQEFALLVQVEDVHQTFENDFPVLQGNHLSSMETQIKSAVLQAETA